MAYRETMENNGMEAGRAKNQIPYCTVVLVALNVILFLIGLILPKAGEWMESEGCFSVVYLLYEHSGFYRLITAAFLHADVEHLLNNMLLLYCCGDVVERCLGKVRFLILYFGSAIFGNLLSAAYELSKKFGVEMPIVNEAYAVLYKEKSAKQAVLDLMNRGRKEECFYIFLKI